MNNTLPEKIREEIKKQGIEPRPRWHFLLKRSVIWSLAVLTTILGGVAVAVIIFIFVDHDASARAYLNESIFEDLLQTIPYLWLGTFLLLIGLTQYAVHHTKFGYRYTTVRILGMVVLSSLMLGTILSAMEVGERVQDFLVEKVPYYSELSSTSKGAWSHPEKGLLGGTVSIISDLKEFELTDFNGKKWRVDFEKIEEGEPLIRQGAAVKIIGVQEDASTFRAVRIFPWK